MKKNNFFIAMALFAVSIFLFTSCNEKDDTEPILNTFVFVDETQGGLEVGAKAGTKELPIKTTATEKQITVAKINEQDWCQLVLKSNQAFTLTWKDNGQTSGRSAKFKITVEGLKNPVQLEIKQLEKTASTFELIDKNQAAISVESKFTDTETIAFKTSATKEQITVQPVDKQDWCTLLVKSDKSLEFTCKENKDAKDRVAKFNIIVEGNDKAQAIQITQLGTETKHTLELIGMEKYYNGYNYFLKLLNIDQTISVSVKTNVSRWTITQPEVKWVSFSKLTGRNGEGFDIVIKAGTTIPLPCTFDIKAGDTEFSYNNIMLSAVADVVTIKTMEDKVCKTNHPVSLPAEASGKEPTTFKYSVANSGEISFKVCKTGTTEELTDKWLDVTNNYANIYMRQKENTTGKERTCDVLVLGGTKELFRFKVTQAK